MCIYRFTVPTSPLKFRRQSLLPDLESVVVVRVDPEVDEETVDHKITHLQCIVVVRVDPEVG